MDKVNKAINKALIWSLVLTIMLPAGIIMIIFGATNKIWVLLAFGIVFVVVGFYGTPLIWVKYADSLKYKRIVCAVAVEKIFSINKIALHLNLQPKDVLDRLDTCIRRGFLIGYIREGDTIRHNVNVNADTASFKCQSCGATSNLPTNAQPVCPYCGTAIKTE